MAEVEALAERLRALERLQRRCEERRVTLRQRQVSIMMERNFFLGKVREVEDYGRTHHWGKPLGEHGEHGEHGEQERRRGGDVHQSDIVTSTCWQCAVLQVNCFSGSDQLSFLFDVFLIYFFSLFSCFSA